MTGLLEMRVTKPGTVARSDAEFSRLVRSVGAAGDGVVIYGL
jgi:hypothetical protein